FREFGLLEPFGAWGEDELAVLANALDSSFTAIAERDAERERFLAAAAHELKTPVSAIKGFAQMALGHMKQPERLAPDLGIIDRHATRLARMSEDLLWAGRAEARQLRARPAPTDLAALTRRVLGDMEQVAEGRTLRMEVVGDAHLLLDSALVEHAI